MNFYSVVSHVYIFSIKNIVFETIFLNAFPLFPCILKSLIMHDFFRDPPPQLLGPGFIKYSGAWFYKIPRGPSWLSTALSPGFGFTRYSLRGNASSPTRTKGNFFGDPGSACGSGIINHFWSNAKPMLDCENTNPSLCLPASPISTHINSYLALTMTMSTML